MMLTASARRKAATCNQILQPNAEIFSQLNIDHIFYAVVKPLEDTATLPGVPRARTASDYPHTSTYQVQTEHRSLTPSQREHSRGRAPLLLSANLGNGYRHRWLRKQLLPDALCGFTRELTFWMLLLRYYFQNKLAYFYTEVRP